MLRAFLAAALLLLSSNPLLSAPPVTHVWELQEIELHAARAYANPYADVECWVDLAGPGFAKRVYGFWDGGSVYRVRVVATVPGPWRWTSGSNQAGDAGLNGKSGSFTANEWSDDEKRQNPNRRGFLRADARGHALQYADGTPFFLLGDTWLGAATWRLPLTDAKADPNYQAEPGVTFQQAVALRKRQGFNSVSVIAAFPTWATDQYPSTYADRKGVYYRNAWEAFGVTVPGGTPTAKSMHDERGNRPFEMVPGAEGLADYDRLVPPFFQSLDRKVRLLSDQGLVAMLETIRRDVAPPWKAYADFDKSYGRFLQYMVARYGAFNLIFSKVHFDIYLKNYSLTADEFNAAITAHFRKYGPMPFGQPVTSLIDHATDTTFGTGEKAPWLTMHSTGNKPRDHGIYAAMERQFQLVPAMPTANLEPHYTGWVHGNNVVHGEQAESGSARDNYFSRAQMFGCVLSGGLAGHVHGTGAYDVTSASEPPGPRPYFWQALTYTSAEYMRGLATFVLSEGVKYRNLQLASDDLTPRKAPGSFEDGLEGWSFQMRTPDKGFGLLYFENKAVVGRAAGWRPGGRYAFTWFDPRAGKWLPATTLQADKTGTLQLPPLPAPPAASGTDGDWAAKIVEAPAAQKPAAARPAAPAPTPTAAFATRVHRNLFREAGRSDADIKKKIDAAFEQLFHGNSDTQAVFYWTGSNANGRLAYLSDINNRDVRSEGMSYGMMIAVQLDKKAEFDALWNWSRTFMFHDDPAHPAYGFFSWSLKTDGTPNSESPAPDGEEYYAMALYFASARWGDGKGIYDYRAMADRLLSDMKNRGVISGPWASRKDRTEVDGADFNLEHRMVRFTPDNRRPDHTDPSYHLPAYYELWARWGPVADRPFWLEAARVSRDFFQVTTNRDTGLAPEYANFDGTPVTNTFNRYAATFGPDAWRTAANWAVDWAWWAADPRERQLSDRIQAFFESKGIATYGNRWALDGSAELEKNHSTALVATNAVASLAATDQRRAARFVDALWSADIPSGQYRYYDGLWYLMGLLHCSGQYRIWTPKWAEAAPAAHAAPAPVGAFDGHGEIGPVTLPGSAYYDAATQEYTLRGSGANMWFGQDEFHFAWKKIKGDFILQAKVRFLGQGANAHRKVGLMARATLDPASSHVNVARHGDGLMSLQFRRSSGKDTEEVRSEVTGADVLQLERKGNVYTMSVARFGDVYASKQISDVVLPDEAYVGIYVCSHDAGVTETAVLGNVRLIRPASDTFVPYRDYIGSRVEVLDVAAGTRRVVHEVADSIQAPNWTPDGKRLIMNRNGRIYGFDLAARAIAEIDTGSMTRNNNDHALSFDGTMLGLSGGSPSTVWTVPLKGGSPTQITPVGPSYLHGWSPDGKSLAFTGQRNGDFDVYLVPATGGAERNLTRTPGLDDGPEFTPDGTWIYFNSTRTGRMQVWRMRPDGSQQEQLTFDDFNNWFPHVSPDGTSIVFITYGPEIAADDHPWYKRVYIRMLPIDGGKPTVIAYVYGGQGSLNVNSWAPDNLRIAFVSNTGGF